MTATLADIERSYGLHRHTALACEVFGASTRFARAVRHHGPLACHFDRSRSRWTLYGKLTTKMKIVEAAERRMQREAI